ncbi:MAG TPA: hypothetical protein VMP03_05290 [Methylomirabilota bacterium]|nr:hypothetical protein [Methylomirabilota bacterium]
MTSRLRFLTARQVFETFPAALDDIAIEPTDDPPLDFLRAAESAGAHDDGIAFCAYLLPRREAVWWACQCLRGMGVLTSERDFEALAAAESWVRSPEEENRRAALDLAQRLPPAEPSTWLAFSAAWTGGSMVSAEFEPVLPPPHLTAKAVRAALTLALGRVDPRTRDDLAARCVASCIRFADGGDATF